MTDASLRVPDLPSVSRELGSPRFPLRLTARLDADPPFTLAGDHGRVTGGHRRGVDGAWASKLPLLSRLRVEGARAVEATLTPLGVERDLVLGEAPVVERIAVPRSGPVCFFEWLPAGDLSFSVTWRIHPVGRVGIDGSAGPGGGLAGSKAGLTWRVVERGLLVEFEGGRALYVFSHLPAELVVTPDESPGRRPVLEVRARLEVGGGTAVRLAAAGITAGADEARVLRLMDRSHVVIPTRRAEATRIVDERLTVEAPDDSLGEELSWAKIRLDGWPGPTAGPGPFAERAARLALASLASGDPVPARSLLSAGPLSRDVDPADVDSSDVDSSDAARRLVVAARYLAWTGDLLTVKRGWTALGQRAERCMRAVAEGHDGARGLIAGALREMVVVAEESGDEELASRLRAAVGESVGRVELARRPAAGDHGTSDPLLRAAELVEAVVHGLLGAEPDAPRGRLVLRPRPPASWTRFRVGNLAVGGAAVALDYERSGGTHRFALRQERGAAPLSVILAPELEGKSVVVARVDGEPAELDPVAVDGRLRVPVQLVLDHERRLELEILGPDA